MCSAVQSALYPSCDTLVKSDGTLSPQGQRAWACIRNGRTLAIGARALGASQLQQFLVLVHFVIPQRVAI